MYKSSPREKQVPGQLWSGEQCTVDSVLRTSCRELSWAGRNSWVVRCHGSRLKQRAKKERVKSLITYCDCISKRLKPPLPTPFLFPHGGGSGRSVPSWRASYCWQALNKMLLQFYGPWDGEARGWGLGMGEYWVLSQRGERCLQNSLLFPIRRAQQRSAQGLR